ncbi:MAG: carbamoyltransferase [Gammaproteobacteria bacterium RIFOXYA12_FULL_61_12]|nr:MAG: carbamoyltransferase [Gammaproteobacteria bacterium RIFOXYD12_FULL_61_37]OGT93740.1 MAG: carbamoyltransferase [Gammaproteobacteria bacterium RIFOXYA12_FULL_61_12]
MIDFHLGINLGHDRSAAIVRNGEIQVAIQQERLDRRKHSIGVMHQSIDDPRQVQLPLEAIHYCLDHCGIGLEELATISANMPGDDHSREILRRGLGARLESRFRAIPSHHLAHAYSAYWPSGFDEALVMVVDASGSTLPDRSIESYSLYLGREGRLLPYHSEGVEAHLAGLSTLGFVYEYISRKAGFTTEVGGSVSVPEAGKLMGLAPYGSHQEHWHPWVRRRPGNCSLAVSAYDIFLEVAALEKRYDDGVGKPYLRPYLVDLAYKVQREIEDAVIHVADIALRDAGMKKVCLAGGVALNSVANYKLYRQLDLDDIFIFPAAGDAGIAAGCALWAYAGHDASPQRPPLKVGTLGSPYSREAILEAAGKYDDQIRVEILTPDQVIPRSAEVLARGNILARFEGGSEFGPRALGHRSILADPTFARMKDVVNARVKFREAFRPFAPVIPLEDVSIVFEQEVPAPFMLLVSDIKEEYRAKIPSVTHYDGTGRVQTVTPDENPYFHGLCRELADRRGGPPVLLNTSFNVAGQPIVETPEEAVATFIGTSIDYLCIEDIWISKRGQSLLDYRQHLAQASDSALPQGLPAGQPAVDDLMRQLDRALFFGETERCPWSDEELRELSRLGARYKETSLLFRDAPFGGTVRTRLSEDAVLILDPLGKSDLIDLSGRAPPLRLSYGEVKWLLAVCAGTGRMEELRLEQQLTRREARERVEQARLRLQARRIKFPPIADVSLGREDVPLLNYELTLEPFADPEFRIGERLEALRRVLERAEYRENAIGKVLGVSSLQMIEPTHLHYFDQYKLPRNEFGDLVRLFLLRGSVSESGARLLFGEGLFDSLVRLGILVPRGGLWSSRIDIFCVDDLYIATDHRYMLYPEDAIAEQPVMYIGLDSMGLVHTAPRGPAGKVLDLCTGSGVQALVASRYASAVVGVDLQPRAVRFARFNAQLNGIDNVRFAQGDLYAAVAGERFDILLANPPFVPSPHADGLTFRDGGSEGEAILRRIVAEAVDHLNPSGRLHIVTDLVDLKGYRAKLSDWWQGGGADMLVLHTADRDEILFSVPHCHWPFGQSVEEYNAELERWVDNFRDSKLAAVNFGYILVHRRPEMEGISYFSRCIHNPDTPIHAQVSNYFVQRELLSKAGKQGYRIDIASALRVRIDRGLNDSRTRIELYVEGDPYYTTYSIDKATLLELQSITESTPPAFTYIHAGNRAWVEDLVGKGVLRLTASPQVAREARAKSTHSARIVVAPPRHEAEEEGPFWMAAIAEMSTKTTPTCLSSYLRK